MPTTPRELLIAQAMRDLVDRDDANPLDLLRDLVTHVVALLPVQAAGATVMGITGEPDHLAASDEKSRRLERAQFDLGEGPSLDSAHSGRALPLVLLRHNSTSPRWPRFAPLALRDGINAVAAVPLRTRDHSYGALSLMNTASPVPRPHDIRLAQSLATTAAASLRLQRAMHEKDSVISHLQTALDSRIVIEQAKGVLAERLHASTDEAFVHLRSHARNQSRKLHDLASEIVRRNDAAEPDTAT
ncbi:GAF and ANTAR domain-containing protein [Amycolatopsis sp. NPDC004079]|uniref:GAF and ANTAR domain-containing protein n=1 Tax=Amycolatopsis sp. NPDC004079 TaxID=3154549 RepID=UPI00339F6127